MDNNPERELSPPQKNRGGRPSDYSPETADAICEQLAAGRGLVDICTDEGMPHRVTVYRWMEAHEEFRNMYARARETQADTFVDQIVRIADFVEDPQKARVMIDARKWVAGKMRPRVYGEKTTTTHEGNPENPVTAVLKIERVIVGAQPKN
jgi:hypothetical protein